MISPLGKTEFSHASQQAARGTLRIAETFTSRQGEGKLAGTDCFFIRTSGCNLRCWFCDTPYASWNPTGQSETIESIVDQALASGKQAIVLTGGEPLVPKESADLCRELRAQGLHVTVETAGTVDRDLPCDLMSISPKFSSSAPDPDEHARWHRLHQQRRMPIATIRKLIDNSDDFQLKFVVDSTADYEELCQTVDELRVNANDVWVMPQGSTLEAMDAAIEWLKPWCQGQGFHFCDRQQIRWFGNRRGT